MTRVLADLYLGVDLSMEEARRVHEAMLRAGNAAAPLVPGSFAPWPKIARLNREIIVTEKIDGTNSAVCVADDGTIRSASRRVKAVVEERADSMGVCLL